MDLQLDTIINSLDDAIISVDEDLRIVFLNEAAGKIFGCTRAQVVGQPLRQCGVLAEVWNQLRPGQAGAPDEAKAVRRLQGKRKDGQLFPLEALVTRTRIEGRTLYTAVIRDITLQQQMENAVYQSRKHQAVGALASGIAHDFNNILTAVISQIDLALFGGELPASLRENLSNAKSSARRAAELVSRLQAFSRQTKSQFAPVHLPDVIEQVVFMLRRSVDPRIRIQYLTPAVQPWAVLADTSQVTQALVNLGLNARDAMPDGGELSIRLENVSYAEAQVRPPQKAGEFVRLTVSDTGHGMPPEVLNRLFEPYFTTKEVGMGSGLGLSITFSVVAEHGGWMEVESQVGHGTTFHVFLPRCTQAPPVAQSSRELWLTDPKALEGHERILVVDDEDQVRMVLRAMLAYRNYQVVEAVDGEDAVQKYVQSPHRFDLVLMDMKMPRLSGRDALRKIRQHDPRVKAVMLSGGLEETGNERTSELEGVAFLQKPFENQELLRVVRQTLDSTEPPRPPIKT